MPGQSCIHPVLHPLSLAPRMQDAGQAPRMGVIHVSKSSTAHALNTKEAMLKGIPPPKNWCGTEGSKAGAPPL
eukprot:14090436-Ditylum_brightwellii.AAC.1